MAKKWLTKLQWLGTFVERKSAPLLQRSKRLAIAHPIIWFAVKTGLVFVFFLSLAWYRSYDPDFGWHYQAGAYIRQHGVPARDIFSYTAPHFEWIDHEWLSDVFISKVFDLWGYAALCVIFAGLWTAAWLIARGYKSLFIGLSAAIATGPYAGIRATTWTVLCLTVLLVILRQKAGSRWRWSLPLLFLIWANIHGGFFIGLGIMAFMWLVQKRKDLLVPLIISSLITFVNPYGPTLYVEIFRTLLDGSVRWQIAEWFPATFFLYDVSFIYCVIWLIGFVIANGRPRWSYLKNTGVWLFLAAVSSNRHFPLFVMGTVYETNQNAHKLFAALPKNLDGLRRLMIFTPLLVMSGFLIWNYVGMLRVVGSGAHPENPYPSKSVAYLREHPCQGNMLSTYNFGGYLIWKLPNAKVFIDGRMPIWKNEQGEHYLAIYKKLMKNEDAVNSPEFKQYNITCVLWPPSEKGPAMLDSVKKAGWQRIDEASDWRATLWLKP